MRVPDKIRDSVVFLGSVQSKGNSLARVYEGTAFIVKMERASLWFHYLVTARHVAEPLSRKKSWFIRVNTASGDAVDIRIGPESCWLYHVDPVVDVAIMPIAMNTNEISFEAVALGAFFRGDPDAWPRLDLGTGDEVFIAGLFVDVVGKKRNLPIIRMGNIAMMPGEPVPTARGEMDAYLIEARSIGGISGSPVFVRHTIQPDPFAQFREPFGTTPEEPALRMSEDYSLLGLMHGHWDIPAELKNDRVGDDAAAVNMGIAIVVPAAKILEVLSRPELESARKNEADRRWRPHLPTMDQRSIKSLKLEGVNVEGFLEDDDQ